MIEIIQVWINLSMNQYHPNNDDRLWMNLNMNQYHPNGDDQNHPTVDEFSQYCYYIEKDVLISSKK